MRKKKQRTMTQARGNFDFAYDKMTDQLLSSADERDQTVGLLMASDGPRTIRHWIAERAEAGTDPKLVAYALCTVFAADLALIVGAGTPKVDQYHAVKSIAKTLRALIEANLSNVEQAAEQAQTVQ